MRVGHRLRCIVCIKVVEGPACRRTIGVSFELHLSKQKLVIIPPFSHTILDKDGLVEIEYARDVSDGIRKTLGCPAATNGDHFGWKLSNVKQALLEDVPENDPLHEW